MSYSVVVVIALVCIAAYAFSVAARLLSAIKISKVLVQKAVPYSLNDVAFKRVILVLGDSTAVGVGSSAQETTAARLAEAMHANVDNFSKSGAVTRDVIEQVTHSRRAAYDLVLIQIGANDVIHLKSLASAQSNLETALRAVRQKSHRVLVLTSGDIGKAGIFSWPLTYIMSTRTRNLRARFINATAKEGAVYVDIFARGDPFGDDPARYYASDGLHLTGNGYGYWFLIIKEYVQKNWPELIADK